MFNPTLFKPTTVKSIFFKQAVFKLPVFKATVVKQSMSKPKLSMVAIMISSLLLSACGGDDKAETSPEDDNHETVSTVGRLAISTKEANQVSVFELSDYSLLETFSLTHTPSALAASPSLRFALAVQRSSDKVEFIDGGLYQEDHVDHLHDYQRAPALVSFTLADSRPTHITATNSQLAVFFDGDSATGVAASAAVLTDNIIETDDNTYPKLSYNTHMHGAAQARGEFLLSTQRNVNSESTLPTTVALYHQHEDHFDEQRVFAEPCPALHGSAQNADYVGFGCADGILLIKQTDATFSASKLDNSAELSGTMRIGTLVGNQDAAHFVGFAGSNMFAIAPHQNTMMRIDWQAGEGASLVGYGFADKGDKFVLLDNQGFLTIFNYHGHAATSAQSAFELAVKLPVITGDISQLPIGSRFELAISASDDKVYITDPINNSLLTVDVEDGAVVNTKVLDFIPHKLVWLGVANSASAHNH